MLRRFAGDQRRHKAEGRYEHEAFSHVPGMKQDLAEGGGYSAFVAPVAHPFDDPVEQTPGMQPRFEIPIVIPQPDTVSVAAHDQPGPLAGSHRIPVDAHDAGNGTAVGLHVGRRIVGLAGDHVEVVFIEAADPGVVPKDRNHPVLFPLQGQRGRLDITVEEVVDGFVPAGVQVTIVKQPLEGVVVAMIAAGLGDVFQLHIGGIGEAERPPAFLDFFFQEIGSDRWNVGWIQRQISLVADAAEGFIAVDGDHRNGRRVIEPHLGKDQADPFVRIPVLTGKNLPLLDNVVCDQFPGNSVHVRFGQIRSGDAVSLGGVNAVVFTEADAEQVLQGLGGGGAGIVPDPRAVSHPDAPVEIHRQGRIGRHLRYRIGKDFGPDLLALFAGQIGVDGQHRNGADPVECQAEVVFCLLGKPGAFRVEQIGL